MMKPLTVAQMDVLEFIGRFGSVSIFGAVHGRTAQSLQRRGLIEMRSECWHITNRGRQQIAEELNVCPNSCGPLDLPNADGVQYYGRCGYFFTPRPSHGR